MRNLLLLTLLYVLCAATYAQPVCNGSFEETDSTGNLVCWKLLKGRITQSSARLALGVPFTATDQGFFISMENDTVTAPVKTAEITNVFPFSATPQTLLFDAFYAPAFAHQRYEVELLFTKWRDNKRDTILYKRDSLQAVLGTNSELLRKWSEVTLDISTAYHDTLLPDSAYITIRNDIIAPAENSTLLFVDHLRFSNIHAGTDETLMQPAYFSLYPNPANADFITLNALKDAGKTLHASIMDINGKEKTTVELVPGQSNLINIRDLCNGLYFLHLTNEQGHVVLKFQVIR